MQIHLSQDRRTFDWNYGRFECEVGLLILYVRLCYEFVKLHWALYGMNWCVLPRKLMKRLHL
jgi:uncharacterized membrane protein